MQPFTIGTCGTVHPRRVISAAKVFGKSGKSAGLSLVTSPNMSSNITKIVTQQLYSGETYET